MLIENNPIERMLSESTEFRYRNGEKCNFNDFVAAFKLAYPKIRPPKHTDVSFTKLGLTIAKERKCKDCEKDFQKECCPHHDVNNVTTTYVILNLKQVGSRFCGTGFDSP